MLTQINTSSKLRAFRASRRYWRYVEYVHQGRWKVAGYLQYVCDVVQDFVEDASHDRRILCLSLPPQHGKSMSITETLPSWYLGKWPERRVIEISYNDDFAKKFGRRNREKLERFGSVVFDVRLSKSVSNVQEWELDNGVGGMQSRGVGGAITGNPADLILIDDPIKNRMEAESETYRERVWDEWMNSIRTRLAAYGKAIVIMTRWHEDDLVARLLANENGVEYINIPCEAEEDDPLYRDVGEPLGAVLGKDKAWLDSFKQAYMRANGGKRVWEALFQGNPTSAEGNLFRRHWWRYYTENSLPTHFDEMLQSWDCTFKDSDGTDFVVGTVWGRVGADVYLLDLHRERMDLPTTMESIIAMSAKWPQTFTKLIEDKANGPAVIQLLRNKVPGLVAVEPKGGKTARAQAILGVVQAGNVWLPDAEMAPWVVGFVDECSAFIPGVDNAKDDQVDSMTQALVRLMYNTNHEEPPAPTDMSMDKRVEEHREALIQLRVKRGRMVRV